MAKYKVCVRCMTYNHAGFISEALNGFCRQEMDSPFVCTVVDDASTDNTSDIINDYFIENFEIDDNSVFRSNETDDYILRFSRHKKNKQCYFAILLLKYNHFSIKRSKEEYLREWNDNSSFIALCEGDDYWTDPNKLQTQINYMEQHSDCTMTCTRALKYSEAKSTIVGMVRCYTSSRICKTSDIILRGGLYIATCSIVYRKVIKEERENGGYPSYCSNCHVGDYPLQIMAAMKGNVYYIDKCMAVYRVDNVASWIGMRKKLDIEVKCQGISSEIKMLKGFAKDFPNFSQLFEKRINVYLNKKIPLIRDKKNYVFFVKSFCTELSSQNLYYRIDRFLSERRNNIFYRIVRRLYVWVF